ncbi:hypothetical protein [Halobaculum magnesiiphilum]|uniref:Uncharacterized protein n=1 Tax=Halobaculum magnesiiphilum TaxID=1017351 RepID=A0A8T8WF94_9EURY|nr:hypothetical protein [Halobaculum magnesiiphilum]QZP38414.1 hypothetical protein K6T50_04545 [Halobaculum magnesiiphilum]
MNRRRLLATGARLAAASGVAALAGCTAAGDPSGPLTPPRSPEATAGPGEGLVITDFTDVEGDDGDLLVRVTVENRGGEERTGTIVATVTATVDGEEREETVSRDVTLAPGERTEATLETSLSFESFSGSGSMRVEIV